VYTSLLRWSCLVCVGGGKRSGDWGGEGEGGKREKGELNDGEGGGMCLIAKGSNPHRIHACFMVPKLI